MLHCVNTSEFSTCYLRNAVLGKSGASAHRFPHPHASLYVKGRIPQYITVNTDCARFKQQDYGGAPKGKVSLFLAAENIQSGICLMMVHDSANHHGAHLHHQHGAEVLGFNQGVFPCVFLIDGTAGCSGRIHCVKDAGNPAVGGTLSIINVSIPVIV